jgi:hypothetical protein
MKHGSTLERFVSMDVAIQESLVSLAADLVLEITALSELELVRGQDRTAFSARVSGSVSSWSPASKGGVELEAERRSRAATFQARGSC